MPAGGQPAGTGGADDGWGYSPRRPLAGEHQVGEQVGPCAGATILFEPKDQFYGDRTYGTTDVEGHHWYFAQHIRDVAPEDLKPPA